MRAQLLSLLAMIGALFVPGRVFALSAVPSTPCTGLIGCGGGSSNIALAAIPDLAIIMISIAGGAGVLFVAWAGLQMVLALGNEGKITEQKWAVVYVLCGLALASLSQLIVSLVGTEPRLDDIDAGPTAPLQVIAAGVDIILTVFNTVFAAAIIVGGIRMVYAQGKSDEFNIGRKIIFWSIIGAVITNLANALVQVIAAMLGV